MKKFIFTLIILIIFMSQTILSLWDRAGWKFEDYIQVIATCEGSLLVGETNQIKVSNDNGKTWEVQPQEFFQILDIAINDNSDMVLCSYDGIFLSRDCGNSWESISNGEISNIPIMKVEISGDTIIAGSSNNTDVFISTDLGETWEKRIEGLEQSSSMSVNSILIDKNTIYINFRVIMGSGFSALYKSTNLGESWEFCGEETYKTRTFFSYNNNLYVYIDKEEVKVSKDNGDTWESTNFKKFTTTFNKFGNILYAGTNEGVYFTDDEGENWQSMGLANQNINHIEFIENNIYASNEFVIYQKEENSDWMRIDTILRISRPDIFEINNDTIYAITHDQKFIYSADLGQTWNIIREDLNFIRQMNELKIIDNKMYICGNAPTLDGGLFISEDNGLTWTKNPGEDYALDTNAVTRIYKHKEQLFVRSSRGLFVSKDNGSTFQLHKNSEHLHPFNNITSLEDKMFIVRDPLLVSTDYFDTWNEVESNYPTNFNFFKIVRYNHNKLLSYFWLSGKSSGVYISKDNGYTWKYLNENTRFSYNNRSTKEATIAFGFDEYIFAGNGDNGIFVTKDEGENWIAISEGLEDLDIEYINKVGDYLIIFTQDGFYRAEISEIEKLIPTSVEEQIIRSNYKIYPNPATSVITISNIEPGTEYKIYNTLGIEVLSGIYNENINVSNLLSGMYFIQLPSTGETLKFVRE